MANKYEEQDKGLHARLRKIKLGPSSYTQEFAKKEKKESKAHEKKESMAKKMKKGRYSKGDWDKSMVDDLVATRKGWMHKYKKYTKGKEFPGGFMEKGESWKK